MSRERLRGQSIDDALAIKASGAPAAKVKATVADEVVIAD
jgi:hypothetical protein